MNIPSKRFPGSRHPTRSLRRANFPRLPGPGPVAGAGIRLKVKG